MISLIVVRVISFSCQQGSYLSYLILYFLRETRYSQRSIHLTKAGLSWLQRVPGVGSCPDFSSDRVIYSAFRHPEEADGFCPFEINQRFMFVFVVLRGELPKEGTCASHLVLGKKEKSWVK